MILSNNMMMMMTQLPNYVGGNPVIVKHVFQFNMPPSNWTPDTVQETKAHGFFGTLGLGVWGWLLSKVG